MKKAIIFMLVGIAIFSIIQCTNNVDTESKSLKADTTISYIRYSNDGKLLRPLDYRSWIFAGTATTPKSADSTAKFPDFQNVYIDPVSFEFWKKNGYFREGTIMVKELLWATDKTQLSIGKGYVQGDAYDIAVTVKDTVRFTDVPGGWEYFHFGEDENGDYQEYTGAIGKTMGCISCHATSEAGFGPFPELYAPLRDAKGFGEGNPENLKNRATLPSAKLNKLSN